MGCTTALMHDLFVPWAFAVGLAALAALIIVGHIFTAAERPGITTEIAAFLSFLFGGLVWWDLTALAGALTVVTVLLLATKKPLEGLSRQIAQEDIAAALQFGVITLIILPVLPDRTFGPLNVINPHTIWLMVVLIAGINFVGYVLIKIFGARQGIGLAGLLGGIASSTAVTLGFSRHSSKEPRLAPEFALGIVVACAIMFIRILVEAFAVNREVGRILMIPIASAGASGLVLCAGVWLFRRRTAQKKFETEQVSAKNPFELWPAIWFGLLFGCILFIAKAGEVYFGTAGVYVSSILTGLADVDPITLSLSNLAKDSISPTVAARGITLAALSNTAVKMLITFTAGRALIKYSLPIFGVMIATGMLVSFFLI
jgi:uncharacterized membrane protein (DUF4010 family)